VLCFRQYKALARKVSDLILLGNVDFPLYVRNNIILLQSLLFSTITSPRFKEMFKEGWYKAGYIDTHPAKYQTPVEYCFPMEIHTCAEEDCSRLHFIRCSWCTEYFCFEHFFKDFHLCNNFVDWRYAILDPKNVWIKGFVLFLPALMKKPMGLLLFTTVVSFFTVLTCAHYVAYKCHFVHSDEKTLRLPSTMPVYFACGYLKIFLKINSSSPNPSFSSLQQNRPSGPGPLCVLPTIALHTFLLVLLDFGRFFFADLQYYVPREAFACHNN